MNCREFRNNQYLHYFGELSVWKRFLLKLHLRKCEECGAAWKDLNMAMSQLEALPVLKPSSATRDAVLSLGGSAADRVSPKRRRNVLQGSWFFSRRRSLIFSGAITVAAGLFFLFRIVILPGSGNLDQKMMYQWNDDFLAEAESLYKEMDRIESGELLAGAYDWETVDLSSMKSDNSLPQDILWIGKEIEALFETMY
jgi:hypothetical protein